MQKDNAQQEFEEDQDIKAPEVNPEVGIIEDIERTAAGVRRH